MAEYSLPKLVAEIGCNHKGELSVAKELVVLAQQCGADYAKFQKRNVSEPGLSEAYAKPHPVPYNSFGKTYGEHRQFLELSLEEHADLKKLCTQLGIGYTTSVWDIVSARQIIQLEPDYIKVPSACNTNHALLKVLATEFSGQVHISTGMTTRAEEEAFMEVFKGVDKERLVIYACTSAYPVSFENASILEIKRIKDTYGDRMHQVGFSGHHLGIAIDMAAYTLGAEWIERHFTKDRTWKGTDHAASLEPGGLAKLARDLQATHASLQYKPTEILDIEKDQRDKLKFKS